MYGRTLQAGGTRPSSHTIAPDTDLGNANSGLGHDDKRRVCYSNIDVCLRQRVSTARDVKLCQATPPRWMLCGYGAASLQTQSICLAHFSLDDTHIIFWLHGTRETCYWIRDGGHILTHNFHRLLS